jgi:hypothetical protein
LREDAEYLLRLPSLLRRLEDQFTRGGAGSLPRCRSPLVWRSPAIAGPVTCLRRC